MKDFKNKGIDVAQRSESKSASSTSKFIDDKKKDDKKQTAKELSTTNKVRARNLKKK